MVLEHSDYRSYLKSELAERTRKNPAYSMRGFAKALGVSQAAISQIFGKKKNLAPGTALKFASSLGLSEIETEYFYLLVQLESAKDPKLRESLLNRINAINPKRPTRELSVDLFRMVSDWYHLVIRNMTEVSGFEFTPSSLAKRLGISVIEAEAAIERLVRLELIERDPKSGKFRKLEDYVLAQSSIPNAALRSFHQQMLEKAIESLTKQSPQEKVIGSETFAISEACIEEARAISEEYFQRMLQLSRRPGKKTQVYHLGVQFFNVSKPSRGEK